MMLLPTSSRCLFLAAALLATASAAWPYDHVIVDTDDGRVQGDVLVLHNDIKVNTFLGIPFAEPPIDHQRWQPPETPERWSGTLIADTLPSACVQTLVGVVWLTNPGWTNFNEDCLYVNVYAPNDTTDAPHPVVVWFFGGGFQEGANIQYPGHFLASKGVVVVVPNYRLNIMGFASAGDGAAPGNYGMLDQVQSLKWVQRNIAAFGGDPNKVMIFGQSAGGASTGLHLVSALSKGLFHSAMPISGSDMSIWSVNPPSSNPESYTQQVAAQVGCANDNNWAMMDCLREIPARQLNDVTFNCTAGYICLGMAPVVDNAFLTDIPRNLRLAGKVNPVPEFIGQTREEATIGMPFVIEGTLTSGLNRSEYEAVMREAVSFFTAALPDPSLEEDLVETITWYYSPWPHLDDEDANRYQVGMLGTDVGFGFANDAQMKLHASVPLPVYQYLYAYISDNATAVPDWMGCPHMLDVPYVWGYPMLHLNPDVRNQSNVVDIIAYSDVDVAYSDFWMTLITNFAKTGNPTPTPVPSPNGGPDVTVRQFTGDNLYYLYVGNDFVEERENYRQHEYAFWHSYLNKMVLGQEWPFPISAESANFQMNPFAMRQKVFEQLYEMYGSPALPDELELDAEWS